MSLTRLQVESVVIARVSSWMGVVDLDATPSGANEDMDDALFVALSDMGRTPSLAPVDADFSVSSDEYAELFDRAERRIVETIYTRLTLVDIEIGPRAEKYDQLAKRILARINDLNAKISARYGEPSTSGGLSSGVITLDFAEDEQDAER